MPERALPAPQIVLGKGLRTGERASAREFVQVFWDRAKRLLRALVDFFAAGGPLS